jgi:hypothetical protein
MGARYHQIAIPGLNSDARISLSHEGHEGHEEILVTERRRTAGFDSITPPHCGGCDVGPER